MARRIGVLILGLALAFVPFAPTLTWSLVALSALAVGQGLASPTLSALLSKSANADNQGGTLGLGQSLGAAARAIGPLAAGWLFDRHQAAPYFAAAACAVVASLLVGTLTSEVLPHASPDATATRS